MRAIVSDAEEAPTGFFPLTEFPWRRRRRLLENDAADSIKGAAPAFNGLDKTRSNGAGDTWYRLNYKINRNKSQR